MSYYHVEVVGILLKKFCLQIFRSITQSRWNQYLRGMGISKKKKKVHFSINFFFLFYFCIIFLLCSAYGICAKVSLFWVCYETRTLLRLLFLFLKADVICKTIIILKFDASHDMTDPCFQVNSVIAGAKCILHCISFKKTLLSCLLF